MIVGRIEHWRTRMHGAAWSHAFSALEELGRDTPEGKTLLGDDGMLMRVMSYPTKKPDSPDAVLEAHQVMIDVQMTLDGSERIDWFPREVLTPSGDYDPAKDVQHFRRPGPAWASIDVTPGVYVVLFPEDAHMPQLVTSLRNEWVKKVVVKIPLTSLGGPSVAH